jgi:glutathione S-transferase
MPLKLYFHPFASFCQKVLIALYENDTPFEPHLVDLADEKARADFQAIWPVGRMPVLRDEERNLTIPETSIIIEYLARHYPGRTQLLPEDADLALRTRLQDRFFDLYVAEPMQKIVTDRLRPPGKADPYGVELARELLRTSYDMLEREMRSRTWGVGEVFTLADCSAAPTLFYAEWVAPFRETHPNVAAYFDRLMARPSVARVVEEAMPYRALFPKPRESE